MKQGLFQQQTIQRKINQTLIQSLQMLQFTSLELYDFINEISKENPLIDEIIYDFDIEPAKYKSTDTVSFTDINPAHKNLYERLKEQLVTLDMQEGLRHVIEYGIDSLNEDGYLDISLEEWADNCRTSVEITRQALAKIQQLEPIGIGAKSLGECLLLQIRQTEEYEPYMEQLLLEHLEWIADYNYEAIMETYTITEEEISKLNKIIQTCNPKPGQILEEAEIEYVFPEANIYKEDGKWKITFYNWTAPRIIFNKLHIEHKDEETKRFLKEKTEQIEWLKRALDYRTSTIELVIKKVVEKQQAFFEKGLLQLVPLTLSDVADELDLHVSTISRAINNKYIQTSHGVFAIKFFFQTGLKQEKGKIAAIVIKKLIRDIIVKEDKRNPFSDETIKEKLCKDYGLNISRRTVMKYRQQLNIESSINRKKVI